MQYTIIPAGSISGADIIHLIGLAYVLAVAAVVWFMIGSRR